MHQNQKVFNEHQLWGFGFVLTAAKMAAKMAAERLELPEWTLKKLNVIGESVVLALLPLLTLQSNGSVIRSLASFIWCSGRGDDF